MTIVKTNRIKLSNASKSELKLIDIQSLIGTEKNYLYIPEHIAIQLKLEESDKREVDLIDGSKHLVPYVGPVKIQFGNRTCFTGALVVGDEVIMGMIPLKDLDLVVNQHTKTLEVNPLSPNIPGSVAKVVRQNKDLAY